MAKGLNFFKYTDICHVLKKIKWDELPVEQKKCVVCGISLTKENIGAFVPGSVRATCNNFACVMGVLLKEKKELLIA